MRLVILEGGEKEAQKEGTDPGKKEAEVWRARPDFDEEAKVLVIRCKEVAEMEQTEAMGQI